MRDTRVLPLLAAALLLAFAWVVWPTPYAYYPNSVLATSAGAQGAAVRRNRFTGAVDILWITGWRRLKPPPDPLDSVRP